MDIEVTHDGQPVLRIFEGGAIEALTQDGAVVTQAEEAMTVGLEKVQELVRSWSK